MKRPKKKAGMPEISRRMFVAAATWLAVQGLRKTARAATDLESFIMIVLDPLAGPLATAEVKGQKQRDYEKLGKYLEAYLPGQVKVYFGDSLISVLETQTQGKVDLIIGKESLVRLEAKETKIKPVPLASLTAKDGATTTAGWLVVAAKDEAKTPADLAEHQILFGPPESDEKYKEALSLLKKAGLNLPVKPVIAPSSTEAATRVLEMAKIGDKGAAFISSFEASLLDGSGAIPKGELKVIGKTEPVPFVVAFASDKIPPHIVEGLTAQLVASRKNVDLLTALDSKEGFVPLKK